MSGLDALASDGALRAASGWGGVTSGTALRDPAAGAGRDFQAMLGRRLGDGQPTTEGEAREAAEMLLATTFVEPILKSLRETSRAAPPFAPTDGEKQMRALLDQKLAHEIVRAGNWPLADGLARDLLRKGATTGPDGAGGSEGEGAGGAA